MTPETWLPYALDLLKWVVALLIPALCWLFKRHEDRLVEHEARMRTIESSTERKDDADRQRKELREELQGFRRETSAKLDELTRDTGDKRDEARNDLSSFKSEMGNRIETVRTETNTKLDKLFDQIGILASTYAALNPRRKR